MIDWRLIVSPSFWFSLQWNPMTQKTAVLMFVVFALFVVVGILFWVLPKRIKGMKELDQPMRKALSRGGNVCVTTGLLGVFFTFTAFEQAGILSVRFWFLLIFILFASWGGWTIWRAHITVPAEREASALRQKFLKYLPKPKRR